MLHVLPVLRWLLVTLRWLLVVLVMVGAVPLTAAACQYVLVAFHSRRNHYRGCSPYFPRTAILVPAWNEAMVIGASIGRLMQLDYPPEAQVTKQFARVWCRPSRPLPCACTLASYVKELRGTAMTWDKTEKTGKVAMPA
jgi:cellulose synthase/poly-beta-1,6-N-acetylglucosamine synthase-like glycosyltransferase